MNTGRRRFLGAIAGTAATALLPRAARAADVATPGRWSPWGMQPIDSPTGPLLPGPLLSGALPSGQAAFAAPASDPAPALLPRALAALDAHAGWITDRSVIGLVDFSVASHTPRMHIVDVAGGRVLSTHLVAHGKGSDPANSGWAEHFSNRIGSEASCSGSFAIGETYFGKHGRSRRILGLDSDNDAAEVRGIVIHAASYVGAGFAAQYGRIGRSQGCFAVGPDEIDVVLERLGPGRMLFAAR